MEKDKNIEEVYSLIERLDFEELSDSEKDIVLSQISREEYTNIRSSIVDTKTLFADFSESSKEGKFTKIKQFILFPVELYKVAAVILLLFGMTFYLSRVHLLEEKELIAFVDTVYLTKLDTFFIERIDTIEFVKEKVIEKDIFVNQTITSQTNNSIKTANHQIDCDIDICPDDMVLLSKIKTKGNISQDTSIIDFIVSIN